MATAPVPTIATGSPAPAVGSVFHAATPAIPGVRGSDFLVVRAVGREFTAASDDGLVAVGRVVGGTVVALAVRRATATELARLERLVS